MKRYCVLIFVIIVVVAIFSSDFGTKIESLSIIAQVLSMLAFIIPTCLLLYLVGKDPKINNKFRIVAKIGNIFLILCYTGGLLTEFIR